MKPRKPHTESHPKKNGSAKPEKIKGTISVNSKATGFIENPLFTEDIEIPRELLHTALHKDEVEVRLLPKRDKFRQTAEVIKIVRRAKTRFAGVLEDSSKGFAFVPDDKRLYTDILVPRDASLGSSVGDKVLVEMVSWDENVGYPIGKVIERIGRHGEHNAEIKAIVLERGIAYDYPPEVEKEAEKIGEKEKKITDAEIARRRDVRSTPTFTIDPVDAKDFDDALSVRDLGDGRYEIGIHIADVSHYVRENTALDREARERGFSVYLVDRTIPMLPEVLSNDLCSLNPDEDKLSFSAIFVMDNAGKIHDRWFGKTVMHSHKRFTYESAQEVLDRGDGDFYKELSILNNIAKKLRKEKEEMGAIDFEQDEIKFVLDEKGKPIRIIKKTRKDTHKLVEEFMLLANREVARHMAQAMDQKRGAFLYRIHDMPDQERIENLSILVRALGHVLPVTKRGVSVRDLKALFARIEGRAEESLIKTAAIRSMAKAVYSTKNIGHYGLAFEYYTHFTSPIRRYADLVVHRLLNRELSGGAIAQGEMGMYEKIAMENSEKEVRAAEAERASIKYKQVEYMMERIGQVFEGTISGVTGWGIYIEDKETRSEGMVSLRNMTDDYYTLMEKEYAIVGEKTKKRYALGDTVRFKIVGADLDRKTLDYSLVE